MSEALFLQLCRLGDCVQSSVLIATWRELHPEDRISVAVLPEFATVFENSPDIDEVILFNASWDVQTNPSARTPADLAAVQSWLAPIRERHFRAVVNLSHNPFSGWLMSALKSDTVRGLGVDASERTVATDPWSIYMLSLLKYRRLNLLNLIDVFALLSGGTAARCTPRYSVDRDCRVLISQWLGPTLRGECLIGFQPGANSAARRWPAASFIQLGRELHDRHRARILVFGSKDEEPLARSIADQIPEARCFAGKTSIPQLAALLERCRILVTNDTGTMHLATAVGTRVVALFESSAYFRETGPYGPGHRVMQSAQVLEYGDGSAGEAGNLSRIPSPEVLSVVESLLQELGTADTRDVSKAACAHFRSEWSGGLVDYWPVHPVPLGREDLCGRLQKAVWLATLDGRSPAADRAAAEIMPLLKKYYLEPDGFSLTEALLEFSSEVNKSYGALRKLHDLVEAVLEKLRGNPGYMVPQEKLAKLTDLENEVLRMADLMAAQPFIAYFETALAMVGGETTREYLQNYQRQTIFLAKQLRAFSSILESASCLDRR